MTYDADACDADVHALVLSSTSTIELTVKSDGRTTEPCEASLFRSTTVAKTDQPIGKRFIRDRCFGRSVAQTR